MKNTTMRIIAVICLGIFIYIIIREGPGTIWNLLKDVSWYNWALLILLRFAYLNLRTLNWMLICRRYKIRCSFRSLFKARLVGYAVGFISPQPKVGAEAVRALMLNNTGRREAFASVVVDKTTELLATIGLIVIGVIVAIFVFEMPGSLQMTFLAVTAFLVLFIAYLYRQQRKGFFIWMLSLLKKFKIRFKKLENDREKIHDADTLISDFYRIHTKTFIQVFLLYIIQFFFWAFEYFVTFLAVGIKTASYPESLLILALSNLAFTLPAVPGSLGIYEITFITIFKVLSIPVSSGIIFILVRRVLGLLISGAGIIPLFTEKTRDKLKEKAEYIPFVEK